MTIGSSYFFGGLIPLLPYIFIEESTFALYISVAVTFLTLLIFGYIKSRLVNPKSAIKGAFQTLLIGAIAAGASYSIVYFLPTENDIWFMISTLSSSIWFIVSFISITTNTVSFLHVRPWIIYRDKEMSKH